MGEPASHVAQALNVAVVSSDTEVRRQSRELLTGLGCIVSERVQPGELIKELREARASPQAVLFDLKDTDNGLRPLEQLVGAIGQIPVIAVSERPAPARVVQAMKLGAADFLPYPIRRADLKRSLGAVRGKCCAEMGSEGKQGSDSGFLYAAPSMKALERTARQIADTDIAILIAGESGSGKEVLARFVHQASSRRNRPFIKVNCAALPDDLLESELFGHEQGAFTGAVASKPGKFELADGGTILLDEIGEMRWALQAKLLHVLQDGKFSRLGGNRERNVDVRVLSSTNRELEAEIEDGRFREDLYFRLKVIDLHVPALRERREDIPLLIDHFLEKYASEYSRPVPKLSKELRRDLMACAWPGNVRELENFVKAMVVLGDEAWALREVQVRAHPGRRSARCSTEGAPSETILESKLPETLDLKAVGERAALEAQRELIATILKQTRWNRRKTARILKVSYKTLLTKMKKCQLSDEGSDATLQTGRIDRSRTPPSASL